MRFDVPVEDRMDSRDPVHRDDWGVDDLERATADPSPHGPDWSDMRGLRTRPRDMIEISGAVHEVQEDRFRHMVSDILLQDDYLADHLTRDEIESAVNDIPGYPPFP